MEKDDQAQAPLSPKEYLDGLRTQFPDIKPYAVDDWDWTWADEGYQYLEACDFGMAELTFQRLVASRPEDADGFEGLAMVYHAIGIRDAAITLIDEAVRLARKALLDDRVDPEVVEEIEAEQERIYAMPEPKEPPPAGLMPGKGRL